MTNNKPSEQRSKKLILRLHLVPWFGKKALSTICAEDIERFKAAQLARDLSPKTVNNHLTVLRSCLARAVDWGDLETLPKIKLLHTIPPERDFLTIDEGVRLVHAADAPIWTTMMLLALRTGMRFGEMCGLEWSCVNMELGVITVRQSIVDGIVSSPKNHRQRFVPFPRSVADGLRALPRHGSYVFAYPNGKPMSHITAERAIHRACARAGLRRVGWHTLRHSCASQLGMLRGTLLEAQRLLGHSSLEMTERYTHIVPAILHQAVTDLDAAAFRSTAAWASDGQREPLALGGGEVAV
jgi:integrase